MPVFRFLLVIIIFFIPFLFPFKAFAASVVYNDDFEEGLTDWTVVNVGNNQSKTSISRKYTGNNSLFLDYNNSSEHTYIYRDFSSPLNDVTVRVFFYDTMDTTLGSVFEVKDSDGSGTGVGVYTPVSQENYVYRFNTLENTYNSGVPRSQGWHMFEITISSDTFVRVKIDNILVRSSPSYNSSHQNLKSIYFVSSWGLTGDSFYDNLQILAPKNTSGKTDEDIYLEIVEDYYEFYKDVDFSKLHENAPMNGNDVRSLFDTALTFYIHGLNSNSSAAKQKAKDLYLYGLNNQKFDTAENWVRGVAVSPFVYTTYLLWDELDIKTQRKAFDIIEDQVYKPLTVNGERKPYSEYIPQSAAEENAWNADFLAAVANFFPKIKNRNTLEELAKCFAYHSITTSSSNSYCGLETQTVHNDFTVTNRWEYPNEPTPLYGYSALHFLARGGLSYELVNKTIPTEFKHNYENLFNKTFSSYTSGATYHFNEDVIRLWDGATDSAFYGMFAFQRMEGINSQNIYYTSNPLEDFFYKRDLLYPGIFSDWVREPKFSEISNFDQNNPNSPSRHWFLDTNTVGSVYAVATLDYKDSTPVPRVIGDLNADIDFNNDDINVIVDAIFNVNNSSQADVNKDSKYDLRDFIDLLIYSN